MVNGGINLNRNGSTVNVLGLGKGMTTCGVSKVNVNKANLHATSDPPHTIGSKGNIHPFLGKLREARDMLVVDLCIITIPETKLAQGGHDILVTKPPCLNCADNFCKADEDETLVSELLKGGEETTWRVRPCEARLGLRIEGTDGVIGYSGQVSEAKGDERGDDLEAVP